jgi:hypothetical protein
VTYRLATERIRERTRLTERTRTAGPRALKGGRHAVARRLHSFADRLAG